MTGYDADVQSCRAHCEAALRDVLHDLDSEVLSKLMNLADGSAQPFLRIDRVLHVFRNKDPSTVRNFSAFLNSLIVREQRNGWPAIPLAVSRDCGYEYAAVPAPHMGLMMPAPPHPFVYHHAAPAGMIVAPQPPPPVFAPPPAPKTTIIVQNLSPLY